MSRDLVHSFIRPPNLGVLVCEAFRERSEQRTNKYREVGGCVALVGGRGVLLDRTPSAITLMFLSGRPARTGRSRLKPLLQVIEWNVGQGERADRK